MEYSLHYEEQKQLGIKFGKKFPYVIGTDENLKHLIGLKLTKINSTNIDGKDFKEAKELLKFPLDLEFKQDMPLLKEFDEFIKPMNESTNKLCSYMFVVDEFKIKILREVFNYSRDLILNNKVVFYSAKPFWTSILALFNSDINRCFNYKIVDESIESILNSEESSDLNAFKNSVSLSLRCCSTSESAFGAYLSDVQLSSSSGKYKNWFEKYGKTYLDIFNKYCNNLEYKKICHSRVMAVYCFINNFDSNYVKLVGDFQTVLPSNVLEKINGKNLEEKILFLNKSQDLDCKLYSQNTNIQGRIVLDSKVMNCKIFCTEEQNKLLSIIEEEIKQLNVPLTTTALSDAEPEPEPEVDVGALHYKKKKSKKKKSKKKKSKKKKSKKKKSKKKILKKKKSKKELNY